MSDAINQIKRLVPISSLLGSTKKRVVCPLPSHPDKHPSCDIDHDLGVWHCKACDVGGTIFDLVMHRDRLSFSDALKYLADMAGVRLDEKGGEQARRRWEQKQRIEKAMAYATNYYHQALLKHKGGLAYLEGRGIEMETIHALKLGWSDGNLTRSVKQANLDGYGLEDFIAAGLIRESDRKPGSHFDYFDVRIIFPLLYRGRVLNMSGRKTDFSSRDSKYIHLAKLETEYFYNEEAIGKETWLFEGHPDTVTAIQCGIPAVGVIGTSGMTRPEKLTGCQKIYICGDADRAGITAADKWATAVLAKNPSCEILFVSLTGQAKDFNEWYIANRGAGFSKKLDEITAKAKSFVDFRIGNLKDTEDLITVWPLLEAMPEIVREAYINKIKRQLPGVGVSALRKEFKNWQKDEAASAANENAEVTTLNFSPRQAPRLNIGYAFDTQPKAHVCLYGDITRQVKDKEETNFEPVIIQSVIYPEGYKAYAIPVMGSEFTSSTRTQPDAAIVTGRWSDKSIQVFLTGKADENTGRLAADIAKYFRKYLWHKNKTIFDVLALFAMGTYVARLFGTFPYLALNGLAGTGKSNIIDLLEKLCFNAIKTVNISQAALFRTIEQNMPTCLRDEAEQYNNSKDPDMQDEISLLNSGYKQGNPVIRLEKNPQGNYVNASFDVFSPKVFAGIHLLNDVLLSRAILLRTYKAPAAIIEKMPQMGQCRRQWEAEGAALRDRMYTWALTKFPLLRDTYDQITPVEGISNRDWELWAPLLSIAGVADYETLTNGGTDEDLLTERIIQFAIIQVAEKKSMNEESIGARKILQTILQLIEENEISCLFEHKDWFVISSVSQAVTKHLKEEGYYKDSWSMTPRDLTTKLSQAGVLTNRNEQIRGLRDIGKYKKCIHLPRNVLEEALSSV